MSADEIALSRIQNLKARLTERDRLILRTLATHRLLTTHQIAELAFDSPVTARHRMQDLEAMQAVDRFRPRADRGSHPSHFVLSPAGAAVVAVDAEQETKPAIRRARRDRELGLKSPHRLRHLLGVNGFHTALAAHARTHPDTAVKLWRSERELPQIGTYSHRPRPDAVLTWQEGTAQSTLALEYDTGTERLARLAEKVDRYATLFARARHGVDGYEFDDLFHPHDPNDPLRPREPRDPHDPVVLFVFTTTRRATEARTALRRTPTTAPTATGVWTPGTSPAEALWLPLNAQPPRMRLAQLVAAASTSAAPGRMQSAAPPAADVRSRDDEVEPW
ncbi:replication-relaxation family protein [Embleya sp. NPDC127516]|uniref:replication-relaxation family protein n=1 Tax=Embleya sp. NPDC127516 TaxID=3363990 RepID=UPI0037F481E4